MDQDKLREDIEAIVTGIFSEKEEADMRKKTEDALQKAAATIEDLTNTLEGRNAEVEGLESTISEHEEKTSGLEAELEAAKQETETVKEQLKEAGKALDELKKDRAADIRMSELEEIKIVRSEEKARTAQVAKIREMSDEEYIVYKDELVAVRQAVLDEIASAAGAGEEGTKKEKKEEKSEKKEKTEEKKETGEEGDGGEETSPANIDPNQAVSAALNMDIYPSDDLLKKYAELGKAMADNLTK